MKTEVFFDYSEHILKAQDKAKQVYAACLEERYEDAMRFCLESTAHLCDTYAAIMARQNNATKRHESKD